MPLQSALGARLIDPDDPRAGVRFSVRGLVRRTRSVAFLAATAAAADRVIAEAQITKSIIDLS